MSQTIEAIIDENGNVVLLESIRLTAARRALVTILEDAPRSEGAAEDNLEIAYRRMAQDEAREAEALEWSEATIGDASDETR